MLSSKARCRKPLKILICFIFNCLFLQERKFCMCTWNYGIWRWGTWPLWLHLLLLQNKQNSFKLYFILCSCCRIKCNVIQILCSINLWFTYSPYKTLPNYWLWVYNSCGLQDVKLKQWEFSCSNITPYHRLVISALSVCYPEGWREGLSDTDFLSMQPITMI